MKCLLQQMMIEKMTMHCHLLSQQGCRKKLKCENVYLPAPFLQFLHPKMPPEEIRGSQKHSPADSISDGNIHGEMNMLEEICKKNKKIKHVFLNRDYGTYRRPCLSL
jgi:hypothetical protein